LFGAPASWSGCETSRGPAAENQAIAFSSREAADVLDSCSASRGASPSLPDPEIASTLGVLNHMVEDPPGGQVLSGDRLPGVYEVAGCDRGCVAMARDRDPPRARALGPRHLLGAKRLNPRSH
jgi:hypothetical protein